VRAEGGADLSRAETAELSSQQSIPVALRPAVVRVTPELARMYRGLPPPYRQLSSLIQTTKSIVRCLTLGLNEALSKPRRQNVRPEKRPRPSSRAEERDARSNDVADKARFPSHHIDSLIFGCGTVDFPATA